jgi:hypothetical protein
VYTDLIAGQKWTLKIGGLECSGKVLTLHILCLGLRLSSQKGPWSPIALPDACAQTRASKERERERERERDAHSQLLVGLSLLMCFDMRVYLHYCSAFARFRASIRTRV